MDGARGTERCVLRPPPASASCQNDDIRYDFASLVSTYSIIAFISAVHTVRLRPICNVCIRDARRGPVTNCDHRTVTDLCQEEYHLRFSVGKKGKSRDQTSGLFAPRPSYFLTPRVGREKAEGCCGRMLRFAGTYMLLGALICLAKRLGSDLDQLGWDQPPIS